MLIFFALAPICIVLPTIFCYITIKKEINIILYSVIIAFFFGIAGYWFINPATDPDLVRYLQILGQYSGKSLFESFNLVYSNLYALDIYFHFISLLGNKQLLPAISVFLFYFITFYILGDYKLRTKIKNKDFAIYIFFVISAINFCSIVNGIRWPLAFAFFFLAFYRESIQKKRNIATIVLYIISILFHFSTLVFVILRLLLFIKNKKLVVIMGGAAVFSPKIIEILANNLIGINSTIPGVNQIIYFINRANMYFQWQGGEWADIVRESQYYKLEAIYYYFIVMAFVVVFLNIYKNRNEDNKKIRNLKKQESFVFYLLIVTIVSFTMSAHTYIRFIIPLVISFCIFTFKIYTDDKFINLKVTFNICLFIFSIMGIVLNLTLLKSMMNIGDYFTNLFTTGILRTILGNF